MHESSLTLVHISDLHFTCQSAFFVEKIKTGNFFSKRNLGWYNYRFRRKRHFLSETKTRLFKKLKEIHWDYLIITGDLTTLSLIEEFQEAKGQIMSLASHDKILLTAGNHDRYVQDASNYISDVFKDYWPYLRSNKNSIPVNFLEIGTNTVIVEFDMAVPRAFYSSRGKLKSDLDYIKKRLRDDYKNHIKIAIGHYPAFLPPNVREGFFHSLAEKEAFKQFLLDNNFSLYLHGHIHKSWGFKPSEEKDLVCINSGGCCRHLTGQEAGFHKIILDRGITSIERILL